MLTSEERSTFENRAKQRHQGNFLLCCNMCDDYLEKTISIYFYNWRKYLFSMHFLSKCISVCRDRYNEILKGNKSDKNTYTSFISLTLTILKVFNISLSVKYVVALKCYRIVCLYFLSLYRPTAIKFSAISNIL